MSRTAPSAVAATISLARPLLGATLFFTLTPSTRESATAGILVAAACASDWLDGEVARRSGAETRTGRLIDNLCDVAFLLFAFAAFARLELWSPPVWGRFVRYMDAANWLPLFALVASFGSYAVRVAVDLRAGREPMRSPRGHAAGVLNYLLVVLGAVELWPGLALGPWVLEPAFLSVDLLNFLAVGENLFLMFPRAGSGPRMAR